MADYIFEQHQRDQELHRLRLLEAAFDDSSRNLLLRAGLKPGMQCLEVGAGAGSILKWMAQRVQPGGAAWGIDRKADHLEAIKGKGIELFIGDILDFPSGASFDVIHARYVLVHNLNAGDLLQHLGECLKPGGVLVLEEPDFEAARWLDGQWLARCQRVNEAMVQMFKQMGLDPGFGRKLPDHLRGLGFHLETAQIQEHRNQGGGPVARVMGASAQALKEAYVATGKAGEEDIASYLSASQDPESQAIYYSTVQVISRKS